ncbi:MAG: hypothetical protein WCI43_06215 [Candidatus Firestonebacteria bacterium]
MKKFLIAVMLFASAAANAAFFDMGQGARPAGMGEAFVGVADDVNALYYNVAGLTRIKMISTTATYTGYMAGLGDSFIGVAVPMNKMGAFGVSWLNTSVGSVYSENTVKLGYAYDLDNMITAGAAIKYMSKTYSAADAVSATNPIFANPTAAALGLDLGVMIKLTGEFSAGVQLENVNSPDISLASSDIVPFVLRAGAGYKVTKNLLTALEIDYRDPDLKAKVGAEYWLDSKFMEALNITNSEIGFRAGFGYGTNSFMNANIGFSFFLPAKYVDIRFDYSFSLPMGYYDGAATHRFSICINEPRPAFSL